MTAQQGVRSKEPMVQFTTAADSPFDDKYDLASERDALRDLLEAENPDEKDPRWPRVIELREREEQMRQMKSAYVMRHGADRLVNDREATAVSRMSGLEDEDQDSMMIHTKEAYRMFLGRGRDPERSLQPIVGGRRVAASLKAVWYLSGKDNPYADWALIDMSSRMDQVRKQLGKATEDCLERLEVIRKRGLNISVLRNKEPKEIELGFKSPYGYTVAEHIVTYDYFVRLVKTLVRKDLISDEEGRGMVQGITRQYRSIFETPVRFERYLMREELHPLSRSDFLPGAPEDAKKRVRAVVGIFGEVPREIFTGAIVPRHSKRRVNLTAQELRLLEEAAITPEPDTGAVNDDGFI